MAPNSPVALSPWPPTTVANDVPSRSAPSHSPSQADRTTTCGGTCARWHGEIAGPSTVNVQGANLMTPRDERLNPSDVLRDGELDSGALLVLWCARKSFFPLLWIGLIVAVLATQDVSSLGNEIQQEIESIDTPGEFFATLVSPFAGILIAFVVRLVVGGLAFLLAYPLTRWNRSSDYARGGKAGSYLRMWWDRVYMTRSFRSLRWSWAVRQEAADRLGRSGQILELLNPILTWANAILFGILIAVIALAG